MGAVQGVFKGRRRSSSDDVTRILCYGDSNTAGFCAGGTRFDPYARYLQEAMAERGEQCEVVHCGLSGLTAQELSAKQNAPAIRDVTGQIGKGLGTLVRETPPNLVLIMLGTNDLGKGTHPEHILQYVSSLHSMCHGMGIPTLAIAPPTVLHGAPREMRDYLAERLDQYSEMVPEVFAGRDAENLCPRAKSHLWEPDQLHFSPNGSRQLGYKLAPLVMESLGSSVGLLKFRPGMMIEYFSEKLGRWTRSEVRHVEYGSLVIRGEEDKPIMRSEWESKVRLVKEEDQELSPASAPDKDGDAKGAAAPNKKPCPCAVRGCERQTGGKYRTCCKTCSETGGARHDTRCNKKHGATAEASADGEQQKVAFKVGQPVEYYSTTNGRWIECRILLVDPAEGVQLDARPGNWIRPKDFAARLRSLKPESAYVVGQRIELYSVSKEVWTQCKVTQVNPDGGVQVDAKPGYWFSKEEQKERFRTLPERKNSAAPPSDRDLAGEVAHYDGLVVGELYEYYSKTKGQWIKCKVIKVEADGSIELNVKPGCPISLEEQAENIRLPQDTFQYYSISTTTS